MPIVGGKSKAVTDLIKALGLDPERVYSLDCSFPANGLVTAKVQMYMTEAEIVELTKMVKEVPPALEIKPQLKRSGKLDGSGYV